MQTGVLHRRTSHHHWVKHRYWRGRTGSTDGNNDITDDGRSFFGGKFIGHCRSWCLANDAQLGKLSPVIELDDRSVSIKLQRLTQLIKVIDIAHHFVQAIDNLCLPTGGDAQLVHHLIAKGNCRRILEVIANDVITNEVQWTLCHQFWVKLTNRPGC